MSHEIPRRSEAPSMAFGTSFLKSCLMSTHQRPKSIGRQGMYNATAGKLLPSLRLEHAEVNPILSKYNIKYSKALETAINLLHNPALRNP